MTIGAIGINGTSLLALATKQKAFLAIVGMLVAMAFFPTNFSSSFSGLMSSGCPAKAEKL